MRDFGGIRDQIDLPRGQSMGRLGVEEADAGQHGLSKSDITVGFTPARIESGLSAGAAHRAAAGIHLVWCVSLHPPRSHPPG